jgi:hypothetical protein
MAAGPAGEKKSRTFETGREPTPGRIFAALTFSFWTAIFGREYKNSGR